MRIFKDYTFSWIDLGILKWSILLLGLYFGQMFADELASFSKALLILGVIGVVYLVARHAKTMFS